MKLFEVMPLIKDSETYAITVSNDINGSCILREITGFDLKSFDPKNKELSTYEPPLEFLMNQEVKNFSSRVIGTQKEDFSHEDEDNNPTIARLKIRFDSESVIELSLSIGQLDEIKRRAWINPVPVMIKAGKGQDQEANHGQAN